MLIKHIKNPLSESSDINAIMMEQMVSKDFEAGINGMVGIIPILRKFIAPTINKG